MDPVTRKRFTDATDAIYDIMKEQLKGPGEGYSVICLIKETMEETYGFRAAIFYGPDDEKVGHA